MKGRDWWGGDDGDDHDDDHGLSKKNTFSPCLAVDTVALCLSLSLSHTSDLSLSLSLTPTHTYTHTYIPHIQIDIVGECVCGVWKPSLVTRVRYGSYAG